MLLSLIAERRLVCMVKLLKSILSGRIAVWIYETTQRGVQRHRDRLRHHPHGLGRRLRGDRRAVRPFGAGPGWPQLEEPLVGLGVINCASIRGRQLCANVGTTVTRARLRSLSDGSKMLGLLGGLHAHLLFNERHRHLVCRRAFYVVVSSP